MNVLGIALLLTYGVVCRPAAGVKPEHLLGMQNLRPFPRLTESEFDFTRILVIRTHTFGLRSML